MTPRIGYDGLLVKKTHFGVGKCILQLAQALTRCPSDGELTFYVDDPRPWPREFGQRTECSSRLAMAPRFTRWRAPRILWQQLLLPRRAGSDRLDLFHATGYVMPIALQVPTVLSVFDLLAFAQPDLCKAATRWHYRNLMPTSLRRARRVIVPSRRVRKEILERFSVPADRVVVVPPGVEEHFRREPDPSQLAALRQRYELPEEFVLFVGRLEPKKNVARLIAAFAEARHAGLEGELILVGGRGWGRRIGQPQDRPGVRWLGYVPDQDLALLYRLASEFVFPALGEGFGLPVLEAMASGAPVVASELPSLVDSDPEAAIRVNPLSVSSIAKGILRVRGNKELREQLRTRGQRAASKFSWDRAAIQTWRIYHEVLAE